MIRCLFNIHKWIRDSELEDEWGMDASYYCKRCGLIKQITFSGNTYKLYRYYREWLKTAGWGVMIGYDTVFAKSVDEFKNDKPENCYIYENDIRTRNFKFGYYLFVKIVEPKHLHKSNDELSKIYGMKKDENIVLGN